MKGPKVRKDTMGFGTSYPASGGLIVRHVGAGHQFFRTRDQAAKFFRDVADWIDNSAPPRPWWKRLLGIAGKHT